MTCIGREMWPSYGHLRAKRFTALGGYSPDPQPGVLTLTPRWGFHPRPRYRFTLRARHGCLLLNFSLAMPLAAECFRDVSANAVTLGHCVYYYPHHCPPCWQPFSRWIWVTGFPIGFSSACSRWEPLGISGTTSYGLDAHPVTKPAVLKHWKKRKTLAPIRHPLSTAGLLKEGILLPLHQSCDTTRFTRPMLSHTPKNVVLLLITL